MTRLALMFAVPVAISGALAVACELSGRRRGLYVFKPLTTALIIAMFAAGAGSAPRDVLWYLVGAGLVASLVGDVLLMLESERFVAGLVSFLVAHVLYAAAFAGRVVAAEGFATRAEYWVPLALLAVYAVATYRYLAPGLGALAAPVAAYVAVITAMGWQAAAGYALARDAAALSAFAGATLFMASDTLLAVDRFRRRLPAAQAYALGTYFAAQWLIAASAA
jgi:uncharacterized membrane protein YhhN